MKQYAKRLTRHRKQRTRKSLRKTTRRHRKQKQRGGVEGQPAWDPQDRQTALTRAITQMDQGLAEQLIQANEDDMINTKNGYGETPLYLAAQRNDLILVEALLNAGANPNTKSAREFSEVTALEIASRDGFTEIVQRLLQAPGIQVDEGRPTPLVSAVREGHDNIVQLLITAGANVNDPVLKPIYFAAQRGHPQIVRMLIQAGANPNVQIMGETGLHTATQFGDFEVVQALLEGGADITLQNRDGQTALELAQESGFPQIVQLLQGVPVDVPATPVQTQLNIPRNANPENSVLYIPIQEGNELVDFHGEAGFGRYYKQSTYNALPNPKQNPATRRPILPANVSHRIAHLV